MAFLPLLLNALKQPPVTTHIVTVELSQNEDVLGAFFVGLHGDLYPHAVNQFLELCRTQTGRGYINNTVHRVQPQFLLQSGDFERGDGRGGFLPFETKSADAERPQLPFKRYVVGLINQLNSSQFFIGLGRAPWLDSLLVIGEVIMGHDVVDKVERLRTDQSGRPLNRIWISMLMVRNVEE